MTSRLVSLYAPEVASRLSGEYGDCRHYNQSDPLDELLFIICSVKTTESAYLPAYRRLRALLEDPAFGFRASAEVIEGALVGAGLQRQKAAAIRRILDALLVNRGEPSLAHLRQLDDLDCEAELVALPGVGKKVARCVMMYSLDRQVFPVDTHCWRIVRRLGWFRPSVRDRHCTASDMDRVQQGIPRELRPSLHMNMVSLGRDACRARIASCDRCVLRGLCPAIGVRTGNQNRDLAMTR